MRRTTQTNERLKQMPKLYRGLYRKSDSRQIQEGGNS